MRIKTDNRQKTRPVNRGRIKELTKWLLQRASRINGLPLPHNIEIILTDDEQIRQIKSRVFGRDEITDVIALRYEPMPGIEPHASAEIFVNVQQAIRRAPRAHWTPSRELALYIAHGCDHLTGADDATAEQYRRMRRRELRWLREAARHGLTEKLLAPANGIDMPDAHR